MALQTALNRAVTYDHLRWVYAASANGKDVGHTEIEGEIAGRIERLLKKELGAAKTLDAVLSVYSRAHQNSIKSVQSAALQKLARLASISKR